MKFIRRLLTVLWIIWGIILLVMVGISGYSRSLDVVTRVYAYLTPAVIIVQAVLGRIIHKQD
ncbi:MAG: hypothetical protein SOH48_09190 [Eubacteriales bacterium]|jgi:heme A synthase